MKLVVQPALTLVFMGLLFPLTSQAHSFPACTDYRGLPVRTTHTRSTEEGPAYSTWDKDDKPIIVFNSKWMGEIAHSNAMVMFVYEHECGHQVLGHITPETGKRSPRSQIKKELDADCYAAKKMREMGYSVNDILAVVEDVSPWPKDPEHSSGKTRAKHIEACYNSR